MDTGLAPNACGRMSVKRDQPQPKNYQPLLFKLFINNYISESVQWIKWRIVFLFLHF
jgi:hypothetical protein